MNRDAGAGSLIQVLVYYELSFVDSCQALGGEVATMPEILHSSDQI